MLVLTRKLDQTITIGPSIKIKLLKITPHAVRLGITAPDNIIILREELTPPHAKTKT